MSLSAQAPFVSVLVWPVVSKVSNSPWWTLSENYAGCFQSGSDGTAEDGTGIPGFKSLQFPNLPTFIDLEGPVDFVRFGATGRVERGSSAALQANPNAELCGLTVQLRREFLGNVMDKEPGDTKAPPSTSPLLVWVAEAGEWETLSPARTPVETTVHPYGLAPNKAFKIKTQDSWDANRGFVVLWNHHGVTYEHLGEPAVRLTWGDKWSLVFRGLGDRERPTIELRQAGNWQCVRVLRDCAPLDQKFWTSSHSVRVQRIGGRLCVDVDGVEYAIAEPDHKGNESRSTRATWPSAPLRVSLWGADVMFRVHRLTGDSGTPAKNGEVAPLQVSFKRIVPAPNIPPLDQDAIAFAATGHDVLGADLPIKGSDDNEVVAGSIGIKAQLLGTDLNTVEIGGQWEQTNATYNAVLRCTSTTAPLLSGLVSEFAVLPKSSLLAPIEIRPAVSSLSVDSGDPENLPDAEAELTLSYPLLKQLIPDWETAILPYRPILIRAKHAPDEEWTTLFRGYLTPDSRSREMWNDQQIPLTARGPLVRLSQPAALIDERFAPLDLQLVGGKTQLWGAQAAKYLLGVELGEEWTRNFNGDENGDPFSYLPEGHYPLIDTQNGGYFDAIQEPLSGNWRFPPPFGDDLKSWIDSLAKYDYAVWFFDPASDAFFYGRIIELLVERGKNRWSVPETAPPPSVSTTSHWPLLSSLQQSGLLEQAYNDIRVWGAKAEGMEGLSPSFIMGRAGDDDPNSLDPISVAQSWRRTLLQKPEFAKEGVVDSEFANGLAFGIWQGFKGRPPMRMDAHFDTGFLGPRWGELLHLPTGFLGPREGGLEENWRILRVKHAFDFSGNADRFSTTLTTRTLSATGQ